MDENFHLWLLDHILHRNLNSGSFLFVLIIKEHTDNANINHSEIFFSFQWFFSFQRIDRNINEWLKCSENAVRNKKKHTMYYTVNTYLPNMNKKANKECVSPFSICFSYASDAVTYCIHSVYLKR